MEPSESRARRGVFPYFCVLFGVVSLSALAGCSGDGSNTSASSGNTTPPAGVARPEGWTEETHGKDAVPNEGVVFAQDVVNRIDITIDPAEWQAMMDDMTSMAGEFGEGGGMGMMGPGPGMSEGPPPELVEACVGKAEGDPCEFAFEDKQGSGTCGTPPMSQDLLCMAEFMGGGPGGGPGADDAEFLPRTPKYVRSTIHFEGKTWWNVGIRLKGNSTLMTTWSRGIYKLPFRLKLDEFEEAHPEIEDQRFYGWKLLSLTGSAMDATYLREKVVPDILREGGVPAARTAFVRIFIDRGEGPAYAGLYTLVEVPDKPLLRAQFGDDKGNLYKPQGTGARWATFDAASFEKKTNEADEDWSDVMAAVAALNASRDDAEAWRAGLEATLDVDGFLRWLALNTVIGNWDTYGSIPHNYFLYGDPEDGGRIKWIPWDHDLALAGGKPIMHDGVDASWPLIRFLLDDPVYRAAYIKHAEDAAVGAFSPQPLTERLALEHTLIDPYVVGAEGEQPGSTFVKSKADYEAAFSGGQGLVAYIYARHEAVMSELNQAP